MYLYLYLWLVSMSLYVFVCVLRRPLNDAQSHHTCSLFVEFTHRSSTLLLLSFIILYFVYICFRCYFQCPCFVCVISKVKWKPV